MKFNICLANHDITGRQTLLDLCDWIVAGLSDLGHSVTVNDHCFSRFSINLLFDGFWGDANKQIKLLKKEGYQIGLITTEIFDGGGFNERRDLVWAERYKIS